MDPYRSLQYLSILVRIRFSISCIFGVCVCCLYLLGLAGLGSVMNVRLGFMGVVKSGVALVHYATVSRNHRQR